MNRPGRSRGVNLVELIISIVIISIACTGVLLVFAQTVRYSADPMVQTQALAVAEAYLDEILSRPLVDPDGTNAGETRATYDNVGDYDNLSDSPPQDQAGAVADFAPADGQPDLAGYQVDVDVTAGVAVNGVAMSQVDVRVRFGTLVDFTLTGYRAP
jgi:MSHA pilin protein MshD